jgi:hypothetical protein
MSNNGSRIAIGARYNDGETGANSGHVRVFDHDASNNDWVQVGNDIDGESSQDSSGASVDMSNDGSRVAIGAPFNGDNGHNSGHERVYELTINDAWVQLGGDLDGESAADQYGHSVALSGNGSRVAIGGPHNAGNGYNSGHVRVFDYINDAWIQLGGDIEGEDAAALFGYSVSLSNDDRLAIGVSGNADVRFFDYIADTWVQVGSDIDGGHSAGFSVALISDGSRVAIGAPSNNDNGSDAGQVRVYAGSTPVQSPTGSPTPSPTGSPTPSPTGSPTPSPTGSPTPSPTSSPTIVPANEGTISLFSFYASSCFALPILTFYNIQQVLLRSIPLEMSLELLLLASPLI